MHNDTNHINRSIHDNRCTSRIGGHVVSAWIFSREGEEEMTEKVKLKREQAEAIRKCLDCNGNDIARLLNLHADKWTRGAWGTDTYRIFNDIPMDDMARALLIGYEVEEEYKVGDWVVITEEHNSKGKVLQIKIVESAILNLDYGNGFQSWWPVSSLRHATPEEIKTEQERRVWAGIGREPGEFRDGDIIFGNPNSNLGLAITKVVDGWSEKAVRSDYYDGHIKGFYPAESFIEFGGGE